ncbi:DUF2029 domain-containing protein [Pendulispora brunnea]|uniref:DUF2029 domain-containing protein n=1 Tax=Pendulispora brunnea TaxID=2905690 RepID=A0ABZ2JYH2_9BACT
MDATPRWPSRTVLGFAYAFSGVVAGAVSLGFGQSKNFAVFSQAARDLVAGRDLYELHTVDYFKYSPSFALLFLPFAISHTWLAAPLWSFANFLLAFLGVDRLVEDETQKRVALLIAMPGVLLATDGDQSNLLVTGAFFMALHALEHRRVAYGAAWVALGAFVKLFPLLGVAFALFRPLSARGRAFGAIALASALGLLLPLLVLTPGELLAQYASWGRLLARDHDNRGWSVMHMLQMGHAGSAWSNSPIQLAALFVQGVSIVVGLRLGTTAAWRRTLACSLLVFTVLFNHRTEYASFVISALAVGVWYATSTTSWVPQGVRGFLVAMATVAPGPFFVRPDPRVTGFFSFIAAHREFHPLRVVPLFLLWILMNVDLLLPMFQSARRRTSARHYSAIAS